MNRPHRFPSLPIWSERSISSAFFYISFSVLSERSLSPGSPRRTPVETDDPFPEFSYLCLSIFLEKEPPSCFKRLP
jgi:hypothetical protein